MELIEDGGGLHSYAIVMVFGIASGPDSSGAQSQKHGSNELAKTCGINWFLFGLVTKIHKNTS